MCSKVPSSQGWAQRERCQPGSQGTEMPVLSFSLGSSQVSHFSELSQFSLERRIESGASGKAVSVDSLRFIILYGCLLVLDIYMCVTEITVLGLERWLCS